LSLKQIEYLQIADRIRTLDHHRGVRENVTITSTFIKLNQTNHWNARSLDHKDSYLLRNLDFIVPLKRNINKKEDPREVGSKYIGDIEVIFNDRSAKSRRSTGDKIKIQIENEIKKYKETLNKKNTNSITQLGLAGEWTCYKKSLDCNNAIFLDVDFLWLSGSGNLVFKDDSMWYFDYPREYYASYLFKNKSNELITYQSSNPNLELSKLELNGDSLVRVIGRGDKIIWTEYYVRDKLDKEIIQLLLRDSVNTNELIGRWILQTTIHNNEDGSEPYEIDFPFELPDSLIFSKEDFPLSNIKGRRITINIEGKSREFRFGFVQEEGYTIWLRPTAWHQGEKVRIPYGLTECTK
jgi:hypothetical protein